MSKVKIQGNASGTGVLTIAAPNTNTDRTITLPDGTGTLLTSVSSSDMPAGSVLQVVSVTYSTAVQTGSDSFTDTGLSASITPSSASSKILVIVGQPLSISVDTTSYRDIAFNIVRGSTEIIKGYGWIKSPSSSSHKRISAANCLNYLDSPSTTSSTTYKTQFKVNAGSCDVYANQDGGSSTITLMEIAG